MALGGGGLRALEDFQRDVATAHPELIGKLGHPIGLQPAARADGDQQRAADVAQDAAGFRAPAGIVTCGRHSPLQERLLVQIPDAAIADRRGKTRIVGDTPRDKG